MKTSLVKPNAPEQEKSVCWQAFWARGNLGAAWADFAQPCAALCPRQFAGQRAGFGAGFDSCGAGWSLALLAMASDLGWKRPFPSAKIVDSKRRRLVEFVGNLERLGKKSCLCWHNIMEGKRPFVSKLPANSHRPTRPSQTASA